MSATNRGIERKPYDFYATPINCIENFINNYNVKIQGDILEPSAGNGNFVKVLKMGGENNITSVEIRDEEIDGLSQISDKVSNCDFLKEFNSNKKYDFIIGNPPYSHALEFVEKSLGLLKEDGKLIFLLRTAFLESKTRYEFWQNNPINGLYVLSKRPSFTGKGSDATSYSWFIWDKGSNKQEIKVI